MDMLLATLIEAFIVLTDTLALLTKPNARDATEVVLKYPCYVGR